MRRRLLIVSSGVALAAAAYWALAQTAPPSMPSLFPAGALLYLEAKDFGGLLADWNGSTEKSAWLGGSNYEVFSRSHLFLKLAQAQTEFAAAAGVPPDYALLTSVAGANSGLAIYNIGDLEFLYVTHLASARAMDTALWKARGNYQTRHAGNVDYYVKQDPASHRYAGFAYTGDTLILATREDLIAGALELLAGQARPSVASEKWFADSVQAAQPGSQQAAQPGSQQGAQPGSQQAAQPGSQEVRMVYNLDRLVATPHFRSYWAQRNVSALREFSSGLSDLERTGRDFLERRVLLRSAPSAAVADETATGQVLALVPDDAGLYRASLYPSADQVEHGIAEKIFASTAQGALRSKQAPVVINEGEAGTELDLETRIDEEPLADDRGAGVFAALEQQLAAGRVQAMLEVASTQVAADQVFVGSRSAIALLSETPWDAAAIREAISAAAGSLWSSGGLGTGWRASSTGVQELDGLGRLALAVDGRWLIVGNFAELVNSLFARRNRAPVGGAVYAAGWRHARELPNFERMMRLIDFPQIPPTAAAAPGDAREPMFYSGNVASLGRALRRVQSATLAVHDTGAMLRESAVYRIAP
jgi:hypothetical protein